MQSMYDGPRKTAGEVSSTRHSKPRTESYRTVPPLCSFLSCGENAVAKQENKDLLQRDSNYLQQLQLVNKH